MRDDLCPEPPPVCTGSGYIAADLQGMSMMAGVPSFGCCGICNQRVAVDGFQRCVTHPYLPLRGGDRE